MSEQEPSLETPQPEPRVTSVGSSAVEGGTFCPQCGVVVPFHMRECPGCGREIDHQPSIVQRQALLAGLGFIILGGILIFLQPKAYHTFMQDLYECGVILAVAGAGVSFFIAVVDMVRRGGE